MWRHSGAITYLNLCRWTVRLDGSTRTVNAEGETIGIRGADGSEAAVQGDGTWRLVKTDGTVVDYRIDGTRLETRQGVATLYRADGTRSSRTDGTGVTEFDATGLPVAFTSSTGAHGHFTLGTDGTYLRTMDDGSEAAFSADDILQRTVDTSGGIALFDASGRYIWSVDGATGTFIRIVPAEDGTWTGTRSDGQVDRHDASGRLLGSTLANGTVIEYPDDGVTTQRMTYLNGLVITDGTDGVRTWVQPDGTVTTREAGGALATVDTGSQALVTTQLADETLKIAHLDGTWTFVRPDGAIEHDAADGTTLLDRLDADGTPTVVSSTQKTVTHADGSYEVSTLDDTPLVIHAADGSEVRYNPDGSEVQVSSTGTVLSITLQDGREAKWDAIDGVWKAEPSYATTTFRADGTLLTEVGTDGLVKSYDADGSYTVVGTDQSTAHYRADGTMARLVEYHGDDTTYDASGSAIQARHLDGSLTRYNADGSSVLLTAADTVVSVSLSDGSLAVWVPTEGVWEGSSSEGTLSRFDATGRLLSQVTLTGSTTTYAADGSYDVLRAGATTSYRADGTRSRFVNVCGDEALYDARGRLSEIHHADTTITRCTLDGSRVELTSSGSVVSVKLADGTAATWDSTDGVWKGTSSDGTVTRFDVDGNLLSQTSSSATVTTYATDGSWVVASVDATTYYRADGTPSRIVTATNEETLYDVAGSPTEIHHANNTVTRYNGDGSTVELSSTGTVTSIRLSNGLAATWDASTSTWKGSIADSTLATYNPNGSLFSLVEPDGLATSYSADRSYLVIGPDSSATWYRADQTMARALQDGEDTFYDVKGLPTETHHADGSVTTYDAQGSPLQRVYSDHVDHFQADGSTLRQALDLAVLGITLADGTTAATLQLDGTWSGTDASQAIHTYSALGAPLTVTYPGGTTYHYQADGSWISTDADGTVHIAFPDGTSAERYADGTVVTWPEGHVVVVTRPNGEIITRDASGHVFTQADTSATKVQLSEQGSLSIACTGGPTLIWSGNGVMRTTWSDGRLLEDHPGGKQVSTDAQGSTTTYTSGLTVVEREDTSRSVTYADGTTLEVTAAGALILTIPDGSQVRKASSSATPVFVPADGSAATMGPDGSITLAADDGSSTTTWSLDGTITESSYGTVTTSTTDGRVVTSSSDGSGTTDDGNGTTSTTYASGGVVTTSYDGTQVDQQADGVTVTTWADGRTCRVASDGTAWESTADGKAVTITLADHSTVHRAADGTVTASPVEGSTLLSQDVEGQWVAHCPGGDVITWATDGSGTITTARPDQVIVRKLDGSSVTTLGDGTRTLQTSQGNYVRLLLDGRVAVQSSAGDLTLMQGNGTVLARSADGSISRTGPGVDGVPGITQVWHSDGSVEIDSADGSTITRNEDLSTDYTWPDGSRLHVNRDGSYEYTLPNGQVYRGGPGAYMPAPGGPDTGTFDAGSSTPPPLHLRDGSTITVSPDGTVTRQYANGDVVTRNPDGRVTRTTATETTIWYPNGSVDSLVTNPPGGRHQTWDALTGRYVDKTSAGTTIYEGNGTKTEVAGGHTKVTLPNGIVIQDGKCSAVYDNNDGVITYPGVRYATGAGYSPPKGPIVLKERRWDVPHEHEEIVWTYVTSYHTETQSVSVGNLQHYVTVEVPETHLVGTPRTWETSDPHYYVGTYLVPPPPVKKVAIVPVDLNREDMDKPENVQKIKVKGFTSYTIQSVPNHFEDDEDYQYTFYDVEGNIMDSLIEDDFEPVVIRSEFAPEHQPLPPPEDLDADETSLLEDRDLWGNLSSSSSPGGSSSSSSGSAGGSNGSSPSSTGPASSSGGSSSSASGSATGSATGSASASAGSVPHATGSAGVQRVLATHRTTTVVGADTCSYASNSQGQLVEESVNQFVDRGTLDFELGSFVGTTANSTANTVSLIPINGSSFPVSGSYASGVFDAGRMTTFNTVSWDATVPSGTTLRFQVAVSATANGPWNYVGPDGTAGTFFTSSDTALTTPLPGRYARYQATFQSDLKRLYTPSLSGFVMSFAGGTPSQRALYAYSPSGNVVSKTTIAPGGTSTDVRDSSDWPAQDRINALNQVLRRDVTTPDGTTTTWRYTYDSAGNLTSKSDGVEATGYAWDAGNHLTQATLPDGTTEQFTYDANSLMLTSKKSTDTNPSTYVWSGNDLVQETAPDGTVTHYQVVNGVVTSFTRDGETYFLHSDPTLGHVRSVTDSSGNVVFTARYDAWGNQLEVMDNVPGGMPARFVGGLGVRWDAGTGLYYMRHRWYDPGLQQFMSTDPLRSNADLYEYANDEPALYSDPSGLATWKFPGGNLNKYFESALNSLVKDSTDGRHSYLRFLTDIRRSKLHIVIELGQTNDREEGGVARRSGTTITLDSGKWRDIHTLKKPLRDVIIRSTLAHELAHMWLADKFGMLQDNSAILATEVLGNFVEFQILKEYSAGKPQQYWFDERIKYLKTNRNLAGLLLAKGTVLYTLRDGNSFSVIELRTYIYNSKDMWLYPKWLRWNDRQRYRAAIEAVVGRDVVNRLINMEWGWPAEYRGGGYDMSPEW